MKNITSFSEDLLEKKESSKHDTVEAIKNTKQEETLENSVSKNMI